MKSIPVILLVLGLMNCEAVAGNPGERKDPDAKAIGAMVRNTPTLAVRRGDRVEYISQHGGLEIRLTVRALDDGHVGQFVRVERRGSYGYWHALVKGVRQVGDTK